MNSMNTMNIMNTMNTMYMMNTMNTMNMMNTMDIMNINITIFKYLHNFLVFLGVAINPGEGYPSYKVFLDIIAGSRTNYMNCIMVLLIIYLIFWFF